MGAKYAFEAFSSRRGTGRRSRRNTAPVLARGGGRVARVDVGVAVDGPLRRAPRSGTYDLADITVQSLMSESRRRGSATKPVLRSGPRGRPVRAPDRRVNGVRADDEVVAAGRAVEKVTAASHRLRPPSPMPSRAAPRSLRADRCRSARSITTQPPTSSRTGRRRCRPRRPRSSRRRCRPFGWPRRTTAPIPSSPSARTALPSRYRPRRRLPLRHTFDHCA